MSFEFLKNEIEIDGQLIAGQTQLEFKFNSPKTKSQI